MPASLRYFTTSNFGKAALLAGMHVLHNGAESFNIDGQVLHDWFGEGRWKLAVPTMLGSVALAYWGRHIPGVEESLHTMFSITGGMHQKERMHLNQQLAVAGDKTIQAKLQSAAFETMLFVGFSGSAAALNQLGLTQFAHAGPVFCAADDLLPGLSQYLKNKSLVSATVASE